ncbi:MAG: cyclopropane-fatty-acyl-phospholipid synthase family protein [Pseudomonadota bacterium]
MLFPVQSFIDSLQVPPERPFAVKLPDGNVYSSGSGAPLFTIVMRNDAALLSTLTRGHMGLLESYFDQSVDVEGDLAAALATGLDSGMDGHAKRLTTAENDLHELWHSNRNPHHAKDNARAHYGLGTDFYRLWLDDPLMMYTCGYWPEGTRTLEQAQQQKIDHVCRKLRLARGETFVDVGCGFGGFMFRALETTGALGTGINTTTEQVQWLRDEIVRRGLEAQLSVQEADFRAGSGRYDKLVSIGVLEHAGRDQLVDVVQAHAELLKPGGLGMLHFIGHIGPRETELFIRKHVFPGGWIPALSDVIVAMERCGLEVIDIENLRRHYALTLDEWAARFERQWPVIAALNPRRFDERFRRIWRTYLLGCAEMFRSPTGYTHLFQVVFSKGNINTGSYPMSRAFQYAV